jgi:hypothetical protein
MNYTELTQALQDYLETTETSFVSNIPTFVQQAEERIYRSVQIPELRKNVTGTMTSGNPYLARPTDFLSAFSIAVVDGLGDYTYLYDKDVNFIREAYPRSSTTGVPKYYAQFDGDQTGTSQGNFILGPTPNANYTVELHYYYDPPSIVSTNTSWLGDNAETALLYGSLIEAYTYLKGDADMLQLYTQRYNEAMLQLFGIDLRSKRDDYRDGTMSGAGAVK